MQDLIVKTVLSFARPQSFDLYGKNIRQHQDNFNLEIILEDIDGSTAYIEEPFQLILSDCNSSYEIENYQIIDGKLYIEDPSNITQLIGRLELRFMFGTNISYPTVFHIDGHCLPDELIDLPTFTGSLYGTDIVLDLERNQTVTEAIDENRAYLDNTRELVDTNTIAISALNNKIDTLEVGDGLYSPNVYYSDVPEETLEINSVNSPLTIARFSPTENGVYEANLSCFVKRTDSANSDETIILYIYDGATARKNLSYNSGKDFDYCYSLTGYQFEQNNTGDVTIKVHYSGETGAELEISGVVATIKKVSE